jgi:glutamate formiminotransferase
VLACVANVSEGRDQATLDAIAAACGPALLDLHSDPDHHRAVFTLAAAEDRETRAASRALAEAVAAHVSIVEHEGVHPFIGALDVVPFVALGANPDVAVAAAVDFAAWWADAYAVPVFLYDDADEHARNLPSVRRDAFTARAPDFGPPRPHPSLGATAVGARPPLVAINLELITDDVAVARRIAAAVRERDGGLPGVRALGFALGSTGRAQVSMNLVDLDRTGIEDACAAVRALAHHDGTDVASVELVGLAPRPALDRCSPEFRAWARLGDDVAVEDRVRG